jgi:hypothetical protein
MSNMLRDGMAWLANKLRTHAGVSVVYRRGVSSVTVTATVGRTLLQLSDDLGVSRMEWTDRDYLVTASALIIGGVAVLPQRGDRVEETAGGKTYVYEVMAPGREPVWKWSDEYKTVLRIHTKQIGTV